MSPLTALRTAIDLRLVPSRLRLMRSEPLPDGVELVLGIAAGDEEADRTAAVVDQSADLIRSAATFYIEQILFAPDADSYRVLGANPEATAGELRRNAGLLLKWLHPDRDPEGERAVFARKVTAAWNDLKTPERRASYDEGRGYPRFGNGAKTNVGGTVTQQFTITKGSFATGDAATYTIQVYMYYDPGYAFSNSGNGGATVATLGSAFSLKLAA